MRWIQLKVTTFCHCLLSTFKKKSLPKHQRRLYLAFKPHITNVYWNILQLFLQITTPTFSLCATYLHSEIGRQNISTPRLNSWNGKFLIGSLYEFTSSQKFSVLVSQDSCLIMRLVFPMMKYLMKGIVDTDILSPV